MEVLFHVLVRVTMTPVSGHQQPHSRPGQQSHSHPAGDPEALGHRADRRDRRRLYLMLSLSGVRSPALVPFRHPWMARFPLTLSPKRVLSLPDTPPGCRPPPTDTALA